MKQKYNEIEKQQIIDCYISGEEILASIIANIGV